MIYAMLWVLPSVLVGVGVGVYVGRGLRTTQEQAVTDRQQQEMLKAMVTLLKNTEKLSTDMDTHNSELQDVGRTVGDLELGGDLELVQGELLNHTARDVFAKLSTAETILNESAGRPKGPLRVTTTVGFGSIWLASHIGAFLDTYPEISISVLVTDVDLDLSWY